MATKKDNEQAAVEATMPETAAAVEDKVDIFVFDNGKSFFSVFCLKDFITFSGKIYFKGVAYIPVIITNKQIIQISSPL